MSSEEYVLKKSLKSFTLVRGSAIFAFYAETPDGRRFLYEIIPL